MQYRRQYRGWQLTEVVCDEVAGTCCCGRLAYRAEPPYEMDVDSLERIVLAAGGTFTKIGLQDCTIISHAVDRFPIEWKIDRCEDAIERLRKEAYTVKED